MKSLKVIFVIALALVMAVFRASAGDLSNAVARYTGTVRGLLPTATNNVAVYAYLASCLTAADQLRDLDSNQSNVAARLKGFVSAHISAEQKILGDDNDHPAKNPGEREAYGELYKKYLKHGYITFRDSQEQLIELKYFKNQLAENANYFEIWANGRCPLTQSKLDATVDSRNLGISPEEWIMRFEPALVFDGGGQGAILGTIGWSHSFFPPVLADGNGGVTLGESKVSRYVQKAGIRAGIGAEKNGDQVDLLLGVGVQFWAVGVWGLYKPDDSAFMLGISMSDLSKLKKIIGWFD